MYASVGIGADGEGSSLSAGVGALLAYSTLVQVH